MWLFFSGKLTDKSDVYAFGVVLLELLMGRKPVDNEAPAESQSMVTWVIFYTKWPVALFQDNPFQAVSFGIQFSNCYWHAGDASAHWQIKTSKHCGSCDKKHHGFKTPIPGYLLRNTI